MAKKARFAIETWWFNMVYIKRWFNHVSGGLSVKNGGLSMTHSGLSMKDCLNMNNCGLSMKNGGLSMNNCALSMKMVV